MTPRSKKGLQIGAVTFLPMVFGAGAAWATQKQNNTDTAQALADFRAEVNSRLSKIEQRQTDIYCVTVPVDKRQGCR